MQYVFFQNMVFELVVVPNVKKIDRRMISLSSSFRVRHV